MAILPDTHLERFVKQDGQWVNRRGGTKEYTLTEHSDHFELISWQEGTYKNYTFDKVGRLTAVSEGPYTESVTKTSQRVAADAESQLEKTVERTETTNPCTCKGNVYDNAKDYLNGPAKVVNGDQLMYSMNNRNGGTVVLSTEPITGNSFINTLDYYNSQGRNFVILSGSHGSATGESGLGANRLLFRKSENAFVQREAFIMKM
ncbi:MAG: hypothetical protein II838_03840 [Lachnospiraceae bacterium]|nr:hypothetical protein [Lachnospiraceae bacterium]